MSGEKYMDIGRLLGDSFGYTKEGLFGKPATWIILIILGFLPAIPIIAGILFFVPSLITGAVPDIATIAGVFIIAFIVAIVLAAFYAGYQVRILRGETPLPAVSGFGRLFADGIRYIVIQFIYAIPVIIILAVTIGSTIMAAVSAGPDFEDLLPILGGVLIGILVAIVVGFIIGLFSIIAVVRFARTGSMGEAFNFGGIMAIIGRIGWGSYILALIVVAVIIVIAEIVLGIIPYIGGILQLIFSPFITIFYSRYISLLYDSAEGTPAPE
ncbi:MAG: DUF4013 domain-containing protein [Methanoregulaceae archaeon]|nr:DUF4013 domain-containing protein [Methanoregulaceae archaeon]